MTKEAEKLQFCLAAWEDKQSIGTRFGLAKETVRHFSLVKSRFK